LRERLWMVQTHKNREGYVSKYIKCADGVVLAVQESRGGLFELGRAGWFDGRCVCVAYLTVATALLRISGRYSLRESILPTPVR
jgi:hypothetical protein